MANPGEEGVRVAAVVGVPGDNNRAKHNREGDAKPSVSSPAVRAREFDQAATKPPLDCFVTFSDAVDSNRANSVYRLVIKEEPNNKQTYASNRISI